MYSVGDLSKRERVLWDQVQGRRKGLLKATKKGKLSTWEQRGAFDATIAEGRGERAALERAHNTGQLSAVSAKATSANPAGATNASAPFVGKRVRWET
jgi:restriction endonuclease Mrr